MVNDALRYLDTPKWYDSEYPYPRSRNAQNAPTTETLQKELERAAPGGDIHSVVFVAGSRIRDNVIPSRYARLRL